jgi:hypothetical protein
MTNLGGRSNPREQRWAAAREMYECYGVPIKILAAAMCLQEQTIKSRSDKDHWTYMETRSNAVLARLNAVFDAQVKELESQNGGTFDEKSARMLGTLSRTFEKLNEMSRADDGHDEGNAGAWSTEAARKFAPAEAELEALHKELERRIEAIVNADPPLETVEGTKSD